MKVEAKITVLENSTNKVKALASITIENSFVVTGIRVIESANGNFFSAMPSRQTANGEYKDVCFPITAEARTIINDEILKAYYEKLGDNAPAETPVTNNDFDFSDLPF